MAVVSEGYPIWLLAALVVFLLLSILRMGLAWRFATRAGACDDADMYRDGGGITIVQAILSGDHGLAACLADNLRASPAATFLWLLDHDDSEGQRVAHDLKARFVSHTISIDVGRGPRDGENPKLIKLVRAETQVTSAILLVLDDDTVLPVGGAAALARAAAGGALATGIPVYASEANGAERFVSGFINSQALPTYFSCAAVGANHTINGMVYALRTQDVRAFGGFAAAGHEISDDYAMARLWEAHGRPLMQCRVYAEIRISFRSLLAAVYVLRRWFLTANLYLSRNLNIATLGLVVLPTLLPPVTLVLAIGAGWRGLLLWLAVMVLKAQATSLLLRKAAGRPWRLTDLGRETVSDTLAPLICVTAFIRPSRVTWRTRRMDVSDGTIRYR